MIISINAEKAFDKIQHPLMIKKKKKTSQHNGNRGNIPQHNKVRTWQTNRQHHSPWAKSTSVPLRWGTGMSAFTILIHIALEVLATAVRKEEEIKGIQIGKQEAKLSLFIDNMILYIENPKDPTKNY